MSWGEWIALGAVALAVGCGSVHGPRAIDVRAEPRPSTPARTVRFGADLPRGSPVSALALRWRAPLVWDPEVGRLAGVSADHLVLEAGDGLRAHELSTGAVREYRREPGVVTVAGDTIVTLPILAPSVGLDPRDGSQRWAHATAMRPSIEGVPLAVSTAGALVLAGGDPPTVGATHRQGPIVAIEHATGAIRWRATESDTRAIESDGDRVIVATWDGVVTRDAHSGREVWRWSPAWSGPDDCLTLRPLAISGDALVTSRECGRIVVLDRATGALRGDLDAGGNLVALQVAGHIAYAVVVPRGTHDASHGLLRAIDLRTARVHWEKRVTGLDARTLLALADGSALLVTSNGEIDAFDRTNGAPVARYRIPEVVDAAFVPQGVLDTWLLVARTRSGHVVAVEPRNVPPADASVRIRGRVTVLDEGSLRGPLASGHVLVDDVPIALDADGRFEHDISTRGAVHIVVDPRDVAAAGQGRPMGCFESRSAWVTPDEDGPIADVALVVFCPAPC